MTDDPWAQYVTPQTPAPTVPQTADPWAQYVTSAPPTPSPVATSAEDDDPYTRAPATWQDTKTALGKALDLNVAAANGVTMGAAPKLGALADSDPVGKWLGTAGSNTPTYEQALADREATLKRVQQENPVGAKVAQGAGSLLTLLAGAGVAGAGADAVAGVPVLGRVAANPLVQGAEVGAAANTGQAAAKGDPLLPAAATGAAYGAGGAALGSAVSRGVGAIGGLFADAPPVMTSAELQRAAQDAYSAADNAGVVYSPGAVARLQGDVQRNMADFGYAPELQPGGAAVLRSLDRSNGMPTTLAGIDTTRKIAGNMYSPTNPSSGALGGRIKSVIDDFTSNPQSGDIIAGNGADGTQALADARRLYNMSSKDQDLVDALARAQQNAGAVGSGGNINNATRQAVKGVLRSRQDWTLDEEAALNSVVMGTPAANAARLLGKASPEGSNGLIALLEMGGGGAALHAGQPAALAVPAVGFAAKRIGDALTARAAANAGTLIRAGGSAAATQVPPNLVQQLAARSGQPISTLSLGSLYAPDQ